MIFAGSIIVYLASIKNGFEPHAVELVVDKIFWEPHMNTDYNIAEI